MQTKKCSSCKKELDLQNFSLKYSNKEKRSSKCKSCQSLYSKNHYLKNKENYQAKAKINNKKYKTRNNNILLSIKEGKPCKDCGIIYPHYVMDFDHLPEFEKNKNVSRMKNDSVSKEYLLKEIMKCDLVCANCHRVRTWNRKHNLNKNKENTN
jgi:hypothetical protein